MNANQFPGSLNRAAVALKQYMLNEFPAMAGRKTLRFIEGNFRAQGFQGARFQRWEANARDTTILIKKGHLRRSFHMEIGPGMVRMFSDSKYAAVHNNGFKGQVTVKAYQRRVYSARRIGTGRFTKTGKERKKTIHEVSGYIKVKSHTRNMNIPQRKMMPTSWNDSPALFKSVERDVIKKIESLF